MWLFCAESVTGALVFEFKLKAEEGAMGDCVFVTVKKKGESKRNTQSMQT